MSDKKIKFISLSGAGIGLLGMGFVWYSSSFYVAMGVYLMMFGNNLESKLGAKNDE